MLKVAGAAAAQPEPRSRARRSRRARTRREAEAGREAEAERQRRRPRARRRSSSPARRRSRSTRCRCPSAPRALGRYVASHRHTAAAVNHFLYQHAWIVTGAKFGWWRGAEALEILVAVDRQAQKAWGQGAKSEAVASAALARVQSKSR